MGVWAWQRRTDKERSINIYGRRGPEGERGKGKEVRHGDKGNCGEWIDTDK